MITFFIQIDPARSGHYRWLAHKTGDKPATVSEGPLAEALAELKGRPLALIVPGETVLHTDVTLNIKQTAKLRKAIPFVLEERLAADLDDMHFALGKQRGAAREVAAVSAENMALWLLPLEEAGVVPRYIIPDTQLLPSHDDEWSVLVSHNRAIVRSSSGRAFACDAPNLEPMLEAELGETEAPTLVRYWNCDNCDPLAWPEKDQEIKAYNCSGGDLRVLVQGWDPRQTLNLMQGSYNQQADAVKLLKPWRWAAILLGVWLAATLGVKSFDQMRLQKMDTQLSKQSETIYRQAFPESKRVVNPRLQMEQKLRTLKGGGAKKNADFLATLSASTSVLQKFNDIKLESVGFRNGELTLKAVAPSLSRLDGLKQQLAATGKLSAELKSADSKNGRASGQIKIKQKL